MTRRGAAPASLDRHLGPFDAAAFVAGFSGAVAASALALAGYLGRFIPAAADPTPLVTLPVPFLPLVISRKTLIALLVILALTLVHVRGLRLGRVVQNSLAGMKV